MKISSQALAWIFVRNGSALNARKVNCFEGEQDATKLRFPFKLDELQSYNNFEQAWLVYYISLNEIRRVQVLTTTVYHIYSQIIKHKQATWIFKCLPNGLELAFLW